MKWEVIKKIFSEIIDMIGILKFILILLFGIFVSFIAVVEPLFFAEIIKKLEDFYDTGTFDKEGTIYIIIFWSIFILFTLLISYLYRYYVASVLNLENFKRAYKKRMRKALYMTYGEYLGKKSGSLYKIFDRGLDYMFNFLMFFFNQILKSFIGIIIIVAILFYVDAVMAIIALSMFPFMVLIGYKINKSTAKRQDIIEEDWQKTFGIFGDCITNFLSFKTLTLETRMVKVLDTRLNDVTEGQKVIDKAWALIDIYTGTLIMVSRILVLGFGVFFIMDDSLSFAHLFLIFAYLGWIYFPLGFIFSSMGNIQRQITGIKKFYDEFDKLKKDVDKKKGKKIKDIDGRIEFKDLSFSYLKGKNVLSDISFKVKPGEKVAFVGNTGAGKSTIINLIFRLRDTKTGEILLDGKNINQINKTSLRQHIGLVTQENSLFNTSIKENLQYANPKATKKQIIEAIRNAQADFVFDQPKGMETVIGERGLKLSGGEKQRLSIARLFLKDPEILILDEATSALDNKTEKLVHKALDKLMKGRTSIIIAHRLSTVQNADKIYVLENGKIVESGSYKELLKKKKKFYELANPDKLIIG